MVMTFRMFIGGARQEAIKLIPHPLPLLCSISFLFRLNIRSIYELRQIKNNGKGPRGQPQYSTGIKHENNLLLTSSLFVWCVISSSNSHTYVEIGCCYNYSTAYTAKVTSKTIGWKYSDTRTPRTQTKSKIMERSEMSNKHTVSNVLCLNRTSSLITAIIQCLLTDWLTCLGDFYVVGNIVLYREIRTVWSA